MSGFVALTLKNGNGCFVVNIHKILAIEDDENGGVVWLDSDEISGNGYPVKECALEILRLIKEAQTYPFPGIWQHSLQAALQ